jgi:hypothetical protein
VFLALLVASANASIRHLERDEITGHVGSTREEILARRQHRKDEYSRRLDQLKQQWDDHITGKVPLKEGFETERLKKKIKAYENKLEHLNQEIDDRVSAWILPSTHWGGSAIVSSQYISSYLIFLFFPDF